MGGNQQTGAETVAEVIISAEEPVTAEGGVQPVLDSLGNQSYQYTYHVDDAGYLLDRQGNSTDVIPNVENEVLICGLRYNESISAYESVELFNPDNTPLEDFWIDAEPVVRESELAAGWKNEDGGIVYYSNGQRVTGLKNIDGLIYYFDSNGYRAQSVGIDVSFYNGNINWTTVKNSGIDFVIIRAGFRGWGSGTVYQDTCFSQNIKGAKAAGLKVGVYFYSTAVNVVEAVEEASIVLSWLGGQRLDCPVYIDMEFSGDYPNGRQDTLSPALRTEIARAFCQTISSAGYSPGVYATQSFFKQEIDFSALSSYSIWLASFTENNALPDFSGKYDIWQFTDFGRIPGVNGTVDFSVIR